MEGGKSNLEEVAGECEPLNWKEAPRRDVHKDTAAMIVQESCWPKDK